MLDRCATDLEKIADIASTGGDATALWPDPLWFDTAACDSA